LENDDQSLLIPLSKSQQRRKRNMRRLYTGSQDGAAGGVSNGAQDGAAGGAQDGAAAGVSVSDEVQHKRKHEECSRSDSSSSSDSLVFVGLSKAPVRRSLRNSSPLYGYADESPQDDSQYLPQDDSQDLSWDPSRKNDPRMQPGC